MSDAPKKRVNIFLKILTLGPSLGKGEGEYIKTDRTTSIRVNDFPNSGTVLLGV